MFYYTAVHMVNFKAVHNYKDLHKLVYYKAAYTMVYYKVLQNGKLYALVYYKSGPHCIMYIKYCFTHGILQSCTQRYIVKLYTWYIEQMYTWYIVQLYTWYIEQLYTLECTT